MLFGYKSFTVVVYCKRVFSLKQKYGYYGLMYASVKNLISISSDSVRRMQKAMELMNLKLHTVISDILGKTGLQMVEAILCGERNPKELIKLKDSRIKASK